MCELRLTVSSYWDETSQGSNTEQGFVAGRYHKNNMPIKPAPHPSDLDLSDLYTHFSRTSSRALLLAVNIWLTLFRRRDCDAFHFDVVLPAVDHQARRQTNARGQEAWQDHGHRSSPATT